MSSASFKIRRSDVNSGGSAQPTSSHYGLTNSMGSIGGKLLSGSTVIVFSGFSNLVSHPDSIEDLTVITGLTPNELVLSWTAPTAYASSGTPTSYLARYSSSPILSELDFVNANTYTNSWVPQSTGTLEIHTVSGFSANTTYYFAVKGADRAGNTGYLSNIGSASTLTNPVTGIQIVNVSSGSITLAWTGLGTGNTEGYEVQASTRPDFSGVVHSSMTFDAGMTTLTVDSLRRGKLTYLRVGGFNWSGTPNFVSAGSTVTLPGPAPTSPTIQTVYASSITLQWGAVASDDGYSAEAATDSAFTSLVQSSVTTDGAGSTLSIQNLPSNALYYLRVGSLYDNATAYAFTVPGSTVTPAVIPINGTFMVGASSITLGWGASTNASGTTYQAELSTISAVGASTATITTSSLNYLFTGLSEDTTYWARVKALGITGQDSAYLSLSTMTYLLPPVGVFISQLGTSSMTITWIAGSSNLSYVVDLAPADPFAAHLTSATAISTASFSGLLPDAVYSGRVQSTSLLTGHISIYSNVISSYTLAEPPITLSTSAVSQYSVSLLWDGNGNPLTALYAVERSTDGVLFTQVGMVRTTSFMDLSLSPGTFYSYRVRAFNENGIPTIYSNVITVMTTGVPIAPREPTGFWAERELIATNQWKVTYHWHVVAKRTDGSALANLVGYQLYKSSSLLTPRAQWSLVGTLPSETWEETTDGSVTYYCWKAVDGGGLSSDWSVIMDDGPDLNHFYLAFDNVTRAIIPQEGANPFRYEKNRYGSDVRLEWTEWTSEETGRVVRSMQSKLINVETNQEINDLVFDPPLLRVVLAYTVLNGQVMAGAPASGSTMDIARIPVISATQADKQLALFWHDGAEWIKTGGRVNTADNTVSSTGNHAGRFQVRAATRPGLTLTRVYPRIFTPNGDGWNDKVIFQFDNPELLPISGKIYDLAGSFVVNLQPGTSPDSMLVWDGKDSGGTVVPGGIYLYQIELGGTPTTGTIVVAR